MNKKINERRVKFLKDYIWKPTPQSAIKYEKGSIWLVKKEVADKAVKDKSAEFTNLKAPAFGIHVDEYIKLEDN